MEIFTWPWSLRRIRYRFPDAFREFTKPVVANEFVLMLGAGLVFAPGVFVVRNRASFIYQVLRVIEVALI